MLLDHRQTIVDLSTNVDVAWIVDLVDFVDRVDLVDYGSHGLDPKKTRSSPKTIRLPFDSTLSKSTTETFPNFQMAQGVIHYEKHHIHTILSQKEKEGKKNKLNKRKRKIKPKLNEKQNASKNESRKNNE